jgi:hypothetical protein
MIQRALNGHGLLFQHFNASALGEKTLSGGNFFDRHSDIDVQRPAVAFLFDGVHRDRTASMHKRTPFHRCTPLGEEILMTLKPFDIGAAHRSVLASSPRHMVDHTSAARLRAAFQACYPPAS